MVILEGYRKLFIGAKVTIDSKSIYYGHSYRNPSDIAGVVTGIAAEDEEEDEIWWGVKWSNGESNTYQDGDLKVLGVVVDGE
ncbi:hypothetical protein Mithridates_00018 [Acinetobacter phage Mithridates]|nr:hypothetical protein Mithridates_00018 [Acinetobacter phage Mithridates]